MIEVSSDTIRLVDQFDSRDHITMNGRKTQNRVGHVAANSDAQTQLAKQVLCLNSSRRGVLLVSPKGGGKADKKVLQVLYDSRGNFPPTPCSKTEPNSHFPRSHRANWPCPLGSVTVLSDLHSPENPTTRATVASLLQPLLPLGRGGEGGGGGRKETSTKIDKNNEVTSTSPLR